MGDQIDSVATPSCAVVMIGGEDALGFYPKADTLVDRCTSLKAAVVDRSHVTQG